MCIRDSVRGVDIRLTDGLTRWKKEQILEKINAKVPGTAWRVQEVGDGGRLTCSEILREGAHLGELQRRLEKPTR